ncbi:hypothetical protein FGIG_11360 [Fasciola gigantica]|uniref:Uncharacterized protein n=1 Tax=Fasciola gigantica TaxID=46835 RepID=A0A504YCB1_FASGI|nr:hypothetical protein FGIG_11360 [Fasciola gigantica]
MQYVSQQGTRSDLKTTLPTSVELGTGQQGSEEVMQSNMNTYPAYPDTGFPVPSGTAVTSTCPPLKDPMDTFGGTSMTDEDQLGADKPTDHRKSSSWHAVWPYALAISSSLAQNSMNQRKLLIRSLLSRFTNSIDSSSGESTSGLGAATFRSSFSAVGDT